MMYLSTTLNCGTVLDNDMINITPLAVVLLYY